jgi:hypothetical protein
VHVTEYLNQVPDPDATEFPLSTIIVKEALASDDSSTVFARVKRGGGYNTGAPGWEWFELQSLDDERDGAIIVWRGVGPPAGEAYGGDPNGCNVCHSACADNDGVCSPPLVLGKF